jgi:protein-tyrosine phosphatase
VRHVLFLCTGNYYRSRFAEACFNHLVRANHHPWRAFSRGLAVHLVDGDLSPQTRQGLLERGIPLHHTAPTRQDLTLADLQAADHIVALKESEHRPLLTARFPDWLDRVEFWHVDDLDCATPAATLPAIETLVEDLAQRLLLETPHKTASA